MNKAQKRFCVLLHTSTLLFFRYEYFLRLVPPDKFQAEAIVDLLVHYNWTYVSLLYSEGSYGENGAKQILLQAKEKGVCLAVEKKIATDTSAEDYVELVRMLYEHRNARAVILFMGVFYLRQIFEASKQLGFVDHFVWIGGDTFALYDFSNLPVDGALSISFTAARNREFEEHYRTLTPANLPNNPWMEKQWELLYNCSWARTDAQSCDLVRDTPFPRHDFTQWYSRAIDGVYTYTYALDKYIKDLCPDARGSVLRSCIKGPVFLQYLRNTSFSGVTGPTQFNEKGDIIGGYDVLQLRHRTAEEVWHSLGTWNMLQKLSLSAKLADFSMFLKEYEHVSGVPESLCSKPCEVGQAKIQQEQICCWECRPCRKNEIVSENGTDCVECASTTWPDDTKTNCEPINASYLVWSDSLVLCLAILGAVGVIFSCVIAGVFVAHRDTKLIKASSRELSSIILGGIIMAYIVVFLFLIKPSNLSCMLNRCGFSLSITLIYAPLLVKTNRIYRIFTSAKKTKARPSLTSPRSQVLLTGLLILVEVRLSLGQADCASDSF